MLIYMVNCTFVMLSYIDNDEQTTRSIMNKFIIGHVPTDEKHRLYQLCNRLVLSVDV